MPRRCSDAMASARPRRCAPSWDWSGAQPRLGRIRRHRPRQHRGAPGAAQGIGYVPQGRGIFPSLSVDGKSQYRRFRQARHRARRTTCSTCFPRLKERLKQSGNTLSGGEQQMLAIARCLMMRPKLIILDEPTEGIMPRLVSQIRREIHRINQAGFRSCWSSRTSRPR